MWWRNFRLSFKLLLGFGLLLFVFLIAIAVTWENMSNVREGSEFLNTEVVPALALSSGLERNLYELFLAVRLMQFKEDDETISAAQTAMATVQKTLADIAALGAAAPRLRSPQYVRETLVPHYKTYVEFTEKAIAGIKKKREIYSTMLEAGRNMSAIADRIVTMLYNSGKEDAQTRDTEKIVARLDLLRVGQDISNTVMNLRRAIQNAVANDDTRAMTATLDLITTLDKNIQTLNPLADTPEKKRVLDEMNETAQKYQAALQAFVAIFTEVIGYNASRVPVFISLNGDGTYSSGLAMERIRNVSQEAVSNLNSAIFLMIVCAGIAVVLGILIAIFISRSIAKPLNTIVGLAKRAGDGDLTIEYGDFGYEGRDELGTLALALSNMIAAQEKTMQQVVAVAENLSSGAGSLSSISEETNASMEEIKSSIDQVSSLSEGNGAALEECNAGVEEMSAGADTVAQSATDSAAFISQTTEASNKAVQTVNSVIAGMRNVDRNAKESESKMHQLVSSVENVSSFVSVITGIADQTNLLALNAAIEAARAGEVGRGFAVVAEEVRKLAEESARAAQNVNGIIVELQSGAQENIKATTESGRMLGDTLVQAERAQEELNGALKEINKANDSIQNIAAVAEEQAASCKEVATAIDSATRSTMEMVETISNIRRASEETAQAAQGVAEQSETIAAHSQTLSDVLSHFRLHSVAPAATATKALKAQKR
ncbi:MAG: methyl-accepting chemotaxis protein [Synergistaceae bacterium]|jgi:methyl-accepting chemotaxis protein|nr:methyl-accepting chemotaxis protein [Synergistaceae bacterium]